MKDNFFLAILDIKSLIYLFIFCIFIIVLSQRVVCIGFHRLVTMGTNVLGYSDGNVTSVVLILIYSN